LRKADVMFAFKNCNQTRMFSAFNHHIAIKFKQIITFAAS